MKLEESKLIEAMKDEALSRIQAARIALLRSMPFYGMLLSGMPLVANWSWLPTAATDHKNLFYNPEFICGMPEERKAAVFARVDTHPTMDDEQKAAYKEYVEVFFAPKNIKEIIFILIHELSHVTNDHLSRGMSFDPGLFNIASDHYINTTRLMELGRGNPDLCFFPDGKQTEFQPGKPFGWMKYCYCDFKFHKLTSEQIYSLLFKQMDDGKLVKKKGVGEHIGDPDPEIDILGYHDPQPTCSDVERERNLAWSQELIEGAVRASQDSAPEDVRNFVAELRKPKINYMKLIKQRMMNRRKTLLTFTRPSKRSSSTTMALRQFGSLTDRQYVVFPGRKKLKQIDIVVGFDVSGSITQKTLDRIFSEIIALVEMYDEFRVTLFCWSTEVGNVEVYTKANVRKMRDYRVTSTGGTIAGCAFRYIDENIPRAKDVIMFTDGGIEDLSGRKDWARKYETLWVISGGRPGWIPPFGKAVNLDERY